jgi:hypothetical protein
LRSAPTLNDCTDIAQLRAQVKALEMQLSQRPSKETVNELEKEYNHLELLLQGTQKENERCMRELDTYVPSATAILLIFDPYAAGPDPGKSNSRKRSRSSLGRIGG